MSTKQIDWGAIKLAVFDVDGTLYRQSAIRKRMLMQLVFGCMRERSTRLLRVIHFYRHRREMLGAEECSDFRGTLLAETARACGLSVEEVGAITEEWMEQRPLPWMRSARYPVIDRVFAGLRQRGILIGVLSDYPVAAKLAALGLEADLVAWAGDPFINRLKPHPCGLQYLMQRADVAPEQTVMIGDRDDRDGEIARRCGVEAWIRSEHPIRGRAWFSGYDQAPFRDLTEATTSA